MPRKSHLSDKPVFKPLFHIPKPAPETALGVYARILDLADAVRGHGMVLVVMRGPQRSRRTTR